ncbi:MULTISPECIES: IS1 family transposase [unclassified Microcoleus]|uniref:IS1 family transposase n=1 Tax=unclassified Microcoleus TaxID=2642155 RepID=UPI0025FDDBEC|nr:MULTISPECIES: IS1 family transposase [unclassified Microcoleus]
MTVEIVHCPNCSSKEVSRNGKTRHGKQNFKCRDCGRQFVLNPEWKPITEEQKELMSRMLLERISQAGIARVLQVSEDTVQRYVNSQAAAVKKQVDVTPKEKKRLNVQMDELWSFVDSKGNQQWVWLALDAQTREIVGVHIGDRSAVSAQALWDSIPPVYRQCAVIYTDHWSAYDSVLPSKRHQSVDKDSGLTSYIERFNCTIRQRVSRLVRKSLGFSKKLENHIAAIWRFVHHYNANLQL